MGDKLFKSTACDILDCIKRNEIPVNGELCCPLSQTDMAINIGVSKVTLQKISSKLKAEGYIVRLSHNKWALTEKGEKTVAALKKLWAICETPPKEEK